MEEARERAAATRQKLADAAEAHQARLLLQAEARQGLDAGRTKSSVERPHGGGSAANRRSAGADGEIRLNASSHAGQLTQLRQFAGRLEENSANLERQRGRSGWNSRQVSEEREVLEEKIRSGNTQFEQASLQARYCRNRWRS